MRNTLYEFLIVRGRAQISYEQARRVSSLCLRANYFDIQTIRLQPYSFCHIKLVQGAVPSENTPHFVSTMLMLSKSYPGKINPLHSKS